MRPDDETNENFLYCLAYAAQKTGVKILFTCAMSNHHHTGIWDIKGNYPDFIACFHKLFAKCQNAHRGRWENFWSSEQTSVVHLAEKKDLLDKMVYALTNPTKDDLVDRSLEWPGVNSLAAILNDTKLLAKRPARFFRGEENKGDMPKLVTLEFARPPGFEDMSHAEFCKELQSAISAAENAAVIERILAKKKVVGVKAIKAQRWWSFPKKSAPKRRLSPRVACKNQWARIEFIRRNKEFIAEHRKARLAWKAGERDVVFPAGTYWHKCHAGVNCEPPPE